jgi:hypothetical protein
MVDAAYFRAQAELCFALAGLMHDPVAANLARLAAEQYMRRANNAEQEKLRVSPQEEILDNSARL